MPDNTVTLRMNGQVSLKKFARALDRFYALVSGLSVIKRARDVEWIVSGLTMSSTLTTFEGVGDVHQAIDVVEAYAEVGDALERGEQIHYPRRVSKPAYDLRAFIGNGVESVVLESFRGDKVISAIEPPALTLVGEQQEMPAPPESRLVAAGRAYPPSYGAISGQVETLARRHTLRFVLYDVLHNKAVSCYVEDGHEEQMRDIWGKVVTVEGLVSRDPLSGRPMSVRRISTILPQQERALSYRAARGASPFHAVSPEDLVRRVRDGW